MTYKNEISAKAEIAFNAIIRRCKQLSTFSSMLSLKDFVPINDCRSASYKPDNFSTEMVLIDYISTEMVLNNKNDNNFF